MLKTINIIVAVTLLGGCSTIKNLIPRSHDPVAFNQLVSIDVSMNKINCSNRDWGDLLDRVHHLKVYTELRSDPQAKSISELQDALVKANTAKNDKFCENIVKINKTRVAVIEDAWKGR